MRLSPEQASIIREEVTRQIGSDARVRLFGSRVDDTALGGDIDLMVESAARIDEPALLAARLSARISRAMGGRRIDVVLRAPNLMELPIHTSAVEEGVLL
jgi:predicted nucleotidyltransferase